MENQDNNDSKMTEQEIILEQYKLYVEMADKISERRDKANVFFMTINSAFIAIVTLGVQHLDFNKEKLFILIPFGVFAGLCFVWKRIIKSYKQLNTAKYMVVAELEQSLPKSPYYEMEWVDKLEEGKNPELYKPLTDVESYVPIIFIILYVIAAIYFISQP